MEKNINAFILLNIYIYIWNLLHMTIIENIWLNITTRGCIYLSHLREQYTPTHDYNLHPHIIVVKESIWIIAKTVQFLFDISW